MKSSRYSIVLFYLLLMVGFVQAQDSLSLVDAIKIGVENNFSIVLAKNNLSIAQTNNTWESVLPSVSVGGTQTNNVTSSRLVPFSGPVREGLGLKSTNLNLSALMDWTVFDGFNMFVTKEKYEEFERIGETNVRLAVEQVVSSIVVSYYAILLQEDMLMQLRNAVAISNDRKEIVRTKYSIGNASALSLMQAQADLNLDSSVLIRQEVMRENACSDLNRLLMRDAATSIIISDRIDINAKLVYETLKEKAKKQNTMLLLARQNEKIAELSLGQVKSARYPQLSLVGGYNYNRNTAAIGFAQLSRSYGPTYGAALSWNLYGGGSTKRAIQNAKIQTKSVELERKDVEFQLESDLYKAYNQYRMSLRLLKLEEENVQVTKENIGVALEKYKLGVLSDIELREIQNSFILASNRFLNTLYEAKQAEVDLLKLSGEIIMEQQ